MKPEISFTDVMIYGANGYTGRLTTHVAAMLGLKPIVAGRRAEEIQSLAKTLNIQYRAFSLDDVHATADALRGVRVVLHMAGPFSKTSQQMLEACLKARCHYLDITGEIHVFEKIFEQHLRIQKAGIFAIPGVGFDVIPTDCLAAKLKQQLPDANRLELAFMSGGSVSPGTAKTMIDRLGDGTWERQDGRLVQSEVPPAREVDFGRGLKRVTGISWGDNSTAFQSTAIPNIRVYTFLPGPMRVMMGSRFRKILAMSPITGLLQTVIGKTVRGPGPKILQRARVSIWGRVENPSGKSIEATSTCVEGYRFTAFGALEAARRILEGKIDVKIGFGAWTPSKIFGPEFSDQVNALALASPLPASLGLE